MLPGCWRAKNYHVVKKNYYDVKKIYHDVIITPPVLPDFPHP